MNEEELEKMAEQLSWADVPKCVEEIKKLWQEADEAAAFLELVQNDLRREAGEKDRAVEARLAEIKAKEVAIKECNIAVEILGLAVSVLGSTQYKGSKKARKNWEADKEKVMKYFYMEDIKGIEYPLEKGPASSKE